jgi:hypothetical protein
MELSPWFRPLVGCGRTNSWFMPTFLSRELESFFSFYEFFLDFFLGVEDFLFFFGDGGRIRVHVGFWIQAL